jgi:Domain of unknown function (DUF4760)
VKEILAQFHPYGEDAPLGTLLFAVFAVTIALWSLFAQKKIARGRAAIDFFLKTEMDSAMLKAYDEYNLGLNELRNNPSMIDFKTTEHYRAIRTYLDINELMAIAIHKKVFSMQVCYHFWCNTLKSLQEDSQKVIDEARRERNGDRRYVGLLALNREWCDPPKFYQRWRR